MSLDCRSCGACCVGDLDDGRGFADVLPSDLARMSRHAQRKLVVFRDQWIPTRWQTPAIVTEEFGKSCAFLRGTPGKRCSCGIYASRPEICRMYAPGSKNCRSVRRELGLEDE